MADYTQGTVTVNRVKLNYYRTGRGKRTLVLLHGATDNGMCWKRVADRFAVDYDIVMPDAQGHGLSDSLGKDFVFENHAHQAAGLIRELHIVKPVIVGHSMGGSTAANIAGLYPDLPEAVILEDPGWIDSLPEGVPAQPDNDFISTLLETKKKTMSQLIKECREQNPSWSEEELRPWAESKLQYDINLFSYLKINEPPYTEVIKKIQCPILLITAESGIVSDATVAKVMEIRTADIPLQHVKIMGAGHNIRREQFEKFNLVLKNFLEDV